jgi:hypothetical protein
MARELPYFAYTLRSRLDKSINSLLGILEGISIDGIVSDVERGFLEAWIDEHRSVLEQHPFSEIVPVLRAVVADGRIDADEREDIRWLCERLRSSEFYGQTTSDLQRLQGVLGGISSDGHVSVDELRQLREWLDTHEHLRSCWPYDEVSSLVSGVLADGVIDPPEHELLRAFFSEFTQVPGQSVEPEEIGSSFKTVGGICAACPEVEFAGMKFCFTGESRQYTREQFVETVRRLGGTVVSGVSGKVDYLVVGADGNPCWAYACYGRKIEQAMALRRSGARLVLVHEADFRDAVLDHG